MLAETSSASPTEVGKWIACFGGLIVIVYYTLQVIDHVRGKKTEIAPQPLIVKGHEEQVSRTEHTELARKVEAVSAKGDSGRKGIYGKLDDHHARLTVLEEDRRTTRERLASIEESIDDTSKELDRKITDNTTLTAEMKGEVRQINQTVNKLDSSITNFLRDQANQKKS